MTRGRRYFDAISSDVICEREGEVESVLLNDDDDVTSLYQWDYSNNDLAVVSSVCISQPLSLS